MMFNTIAVSMKNMYHFVKSEKLVKMPPFLDNKLFSVFRVQWFDGVATYYNNNTSTTEPSIIIFSKKLRVQN